MRFEVAPTPVGRHGRRWSGLIAAGAVVGLLVASFASAFLGRPSDDSTATTVRSATPGPAVGEGIARSPAPPSVAPGGAATGGPAPGDAGQAPSGAARVPASIACHGLTRAACLDTVDAAIAILPPGLPAIRTAAAWDSLLCGDTLDCPLGRLSRADPVGSVVVTFAGGGPSAMINVVRPEATSGMRLPVPLEAWLARWSD